MEITNWKNCRNSSRVNGGGRTENTILQMREVIICRNISDRAIIDGGSEFYRIRREFLRCDRKLILVSLSPWKRKELEYFMSVIWEEEKCLDNVTFLAQFGMKKDKKDFQKQYRIPIHTLPFMEDPLHLKEAERLFFTTLV